MNIYFGYIIVLIITLFAWFIHMTADCTFRFFNDRHTKDKGYEILHKKYNMPKQMTLTREIQALPHGFVFPVVLKPVNASQGTDVYMDINALELHQISKALLTKYKKIVIENQISGFKECRVLVNTTYNYMTVTERLPISVVGDGIHSIEQLANKPNNQKNNDHHKIVIDDRYVDRKRIPINGETVVVNNRRNTSLGGKINILDMNTVHPDNIQMFKEMTKDIGSSFNGLDIFYIDLSVSHKQLPIILLETNFCPGINKTQIFTDQFAPIRYSLYKSLAFVSLVYFMVVVPNYAR
jgi:D-alanine-D-alanine ligase-like ATP-grasp enzyme